jgi:hypothetical protein
MRYLRSINSFCFPKDKASIARAIYPLCFARAKIGTCEFVIAGSLGSLIKFAAVPLPVFEEAKLHNGGYRHFRSQEDYDPNRKKA